MRQAYLSHLARAQAFEREGRALEAALSFGQAVKVAPHAAARLEALTGLLGNAELSLHQEVYELHEDGASWRMIGHYTALSWQTLHRRYRGAPARMRPKPEKLPRRKPGPRRRIAD